MMVVGLLLAQLVLPGPWLDSPRVQPGPTICVGECAGPVVWGQAERGRLVVACDMRSDTCSDGRRITTVRASPVPCEVSPGVWEMVSENTGCYGVRGLESWAATTSYLSWGAELDRSPWQAVEGAAIDGRILTGPVGSARLLQSVLPVSTGPHTLACRMRALSGNSTRLRVFASGGTGHSIAAKSVGPEWATVFHTWEIGGEPTNLSAHIYPDGSTLEIAGCWLTKTATPGRACWGGEAPVTCAADQHTISTEGWPTTEGEISFAFSLSEPLSGSSRQYHYVLDSRVAEESSTFFAVRGDGRFFLGGGVPSASPLPWDTGTTYAIRVRAAEGAVRVWRNGVVIHEAAGGFVWGGATARVGARHTKSQHLNGSIRSLTVRSFE